ncbi:F0F1 ATP synthase subunit B [Bradymonas sediminis]|uniref:ATP synthase subunit b n=1 Tax=Bradymonas sediminis TaxID=1548548 RepID=A0A2Z4FKN7_9DELT|nr:F0F1 ATP synthase subunit B [Bradymonas sediminis]AWV89264.1 F0F1 ATP synthase subunit B [Bradymonas sediminis]TDP73435.1 ATP synthase F0 subcomplex B subunit [Bradymonas sediminis]
MVVDWFTVVAQMLNFLVLVWLLKRFLYLPILNAIDAREHKIATELADAAAKQSLADAQHEKFQQKSAQLDAERDALLRQAHVEAAEERQRLVDQGRRAAERIRAEREEALRSEFQSLQNIITGQSRDAVFATTRKVLKELAGVSLEARIVELFGERLRGLDPASVDNLRATAGDDAQPMLIQSAFELGDAQKDALRATLSQVFGAPAAVEFKTVDGLIAGIELMLDGFKVAWSISEYLVEMEKNISEILGEHKPRLHAGKNYELV